MYTVTDTVKCTQITHPHQHISGQTRTGIMYVTHLLYTLSLSEMWNTRKWFLPSSANTSKAHCLSRYLCLWISHMDLYGHLIQLHITGDRGRTYISDLDVYCVCEPASMVMTLCSYGYSEYSRLESQKPLYNV